MLLKGSCYCRAVRFSVESETPYPYLWCYCSICRKTAGGGGYAINIMGQAETLKVKGRTRIYKARPSWGERHFCGKCASALWVWDKRWPQWVYSLCLGDRYTLAGPARAPIHLPQRKAELGGSAQAR